MLLFHRELGGAGRPPLVILHGMLGSSRNWQTAGRDLAARYHVWALDLRNHGGSPQATAMTPAVLAADVQAWLDARNRRVGATPAPFRGVPCVYRGVPYRSLAEAIRVSGAKAAQVYAGARRIGGQP